VSSSSAKRSPTAHRGLRPLGVSSPSPTTWLQIFPGEIEATAGDPGRHVTQPGKIWSFGLFHSCGAC